MPEAQQYDSRYLEGIRLFNECEFFEAHDVWEELWADYQGESRKFYQGLIQTAVCLHHFGNENIRGARKLFVSSRQYLEPYRPRHEGINLDNLFADMERCCEEMLTAEGEFPNVQIDPELIPEIHLEDAQSAEA